MSTADLPMAGVRSRKARSPFYFNAAVHLVRVLPQTATELSELLEGLRTAPDSSIFQHTFRTRQEHHFLRGFHNDFAQWAFAACNQVALAEQLAAVDVRQFSTIAALRERLIEIVARDLELRARASERAALEKFYFCAADTAVLPTPFVANNLPEFLQNLQRVPISSIHYHFVEARLRLKLNSNDFSEWLDRELDLGPIADHVNRIDIYTSTLHELRRMIIHMVESALPETRGDARAASNGEKHG